jgi:hypothetical protein
VTQLVLALHEDAVEPLQVVAESIDPVAADPTAVEPLHVVAGAALTETSFLCVQV